MTHRQLKPWYFAVEGLNSFATGLYYNYLFFYLHDHFGFGDLQNLAFAATNGLLYTVFSWIGGRIGQARGPFTALRFGCSVMAAALLAGCFLPFATAQVLVMAGWTFGIGFTWANLEALTSDHEPPGRIPRMVGIYNLVWAGAAALAYFSGGAILELLGALSLFTVPIVLHGAQLAIIQWVEPRARLALESPAPPNLDHLDHPDRPSPARARLFLRLAWLANPFAYIAISAVIPVIPGLANRFDLSPMWAGFFCSIWFFARLGAFALLWLWPRWHYRFGWFTGAFALLIGSFIFLLTSHSLLVVLFAQLAFGASCGLLYYASLFYSMDVSDTKSEHGGLHEAAIGAGIFAGPATGAAGLWFFPQHPAASTWTVATLLLIGFLTFLAMAWKGMAEVRAGRTGQGGEA